MKDPRSTLQRILAINTSRSPDSVRRFFVDGRRSGAMSSTEEESDSRVREEKKSAEKAPSRPPPPEKPEPGDCCGSGCVRCVWDVYYEELDAYNKLYNEDSENSTPKS